MSAFLKIVSAALAVVLAAQAADRADVVLTTGRILSGARIVAIGDRTATVVHSGGTENVPLEDVPLDALARAKISLDAAAAETARQAAAIAAKAEQARAEKQKQRETIQRALEAKAAKQKNPPGNAAPRTAESPDARLLALKAKFPPKRVESIAFYRDKRLVGGSQSTSSIQPNGDGYIVTTNRSPAAVIVGRPDTMTVEVPHPDLWSDYRGWIQTATLQSLPASLERLDQRIEADLVKLGGQTSSVMNSLNAAQARLTIDWINQTLRPYLVQVRALAASAR